MDRSASSVRKDQGSMIKVKQAAVSTISIVPLLWYRTIWYFTLKEDCHVHRPCTLPSLWPITTREVDKVLYSRRNSSESLPCHYLARADCSCVVRGHKWEESDLPARGSASEPVCTMVRTRQLVIHYPVSVGRQLCTSEEWKRVKTREPVLTVNMLSSAILPSHLQMTALVFAAMVMTAEGRIANFIRSKFRGAMNRISSHPVPHITDKNDYADWHNVCTLVFEYRQRYEGSRRSSSCRRLKQ